MSKYRIDETTTSDGRAQITVLDFVNRSTYIVDYLPSHYHPSTPFAKGEQLYCGEDLHAALRAVRLVFGARVKLPSALVKRAGRRGKIGTPKGI